MEGGSSAADGSSNDAESSDEDEAQHEKELSAVRRSKLIVDSHLTDIAVKRKYLASKNHKDTQQEGAVFL